MADAGKKSDWAISEATRKLMSNPLIRYLNDLPGHKELNAALSEANKLISTNASDRSDRSDKTG